MFRQRLNQWRKKFYKSPTMSMQEYPKFNAKTYRRETRYLWSKVQEEVGREWVLIEGKEINLCLCELSLMALLIFAGRGERG